MIVRVRVEASDETKEQVKDELLDAAQLVQEHYGGAWEPAEDNPDCEPVLVPTVGGFWGRLTIRKKVDDGSQAQ